MRKILLCMIVSTIIVGQANAQAIRWSNKSVSPHALTEEGYAIAADSLGYTYITGSFTDTVTFGSTTLKGKGGKDIFLAKLDTLGHYLWAKSFGSNGDDEGYGICLDNACNIYITGYFNSTLHITATDSLVTTGSTDIFIAKFDNSGNLLLKIKEGNTTADYGRGICVNPSNGDFAVVGDQYANTRYWTAKYNSAGTKLFEKLYVSSTSATGTGICMDNAGTVYTCGYFSGTMSTPNLTSSGIDAFCLVFNTTGATTKYKGNFGSTSSDYAYSIACKPDGSKFYLCGGFTTSINFGYDVYSSYVTLSGSGSYAYLTCFGLAGSVYDPVWAQKGAFGPTAYSSVRLDRSGNPVIADNVLNTIKYMNYGGASAWSSYPTYSNGNGSSNDCVAIDKKGNIYTSGKFRSTFTFGDSTYATGNYATVFVQKISSVIIQSPAAGSNLCVSSSLGDSLNVVIAPTMNYKAGNVFTLQIDTTGATTFTHPINIGSLTATYNGTIHAFVPKSVADISYAYMRVISSNPATTTGDQTYISILPQPVARISVDSIFRCANGSGVSVTVYEDNPNGGTSGYNYQWNPSTYLSAPQSATTTVYPPVSVKYTISVTDIANGCVGTDTLHAITWPMPQIDTGNDTIICKGASITLHAIGNDIATYSWTPTATLQNPTSANPVATPTALNTQYMCQVVSNHGCTNNSTIQVTTFTVNANAGPASYNTCIGGAVQLTGTTSGQTFNWTPSTGLNNPHIANPVATPNLTTKYYLIGTDTNYHCFARDSITINVGAIVVNANDPTATCGSSASITATPVGNYVTPLTYTWSPATSLSATTGSSVTANPITNKTYYVVMTTANGCSGFDSSKVTINSPNYNVSFTSTQQLFTSPPFAVQFTNSTGSMSNYTFTWIWGDGTTTQSNNTSVFHVYSYNGNYDVTLIAVSNSTGCSDSLVRTGYIFCMGGTACSLTATVTAPHGTTACQGDSIQLKSNTGTGYTYQWNLNGSPVSGAVSSTFYAKVQGNYSISVGDGTCTVVSQSVSVSINTPPAAPVISHTGSVTLCSGGTMFLSASSGYTTYSWSTGATTQNISVTQSGTYTVSVSMGGGCTSSSSYTLNASAMAAPDICVVGVDSLTGKNMLIWDKPVTGQIDSFIVYKEGIVANQFNRIGAVAYNHFSTFEDVNSNPQQQAYRYKLSIRDTCGTETLLGNYHKTIHLTINQGVGNQWNLIWNNYEGFTVSTYRIYRGTTTSNISLLTSIASTYNSYTDLTPPVGMVYYQIEAVNPGGCTPSFKSITQNYSSSKSNIVDNGGGVITNLVEQSNNSSVIIYPNPANNELNIKFKNAGNDFNALIEITDILGRLIQGSEIALSASDNIAHLDIHNIADGVYTVHIRNNGNEFIERLVVRK